MSFGGIRAVILIVVLILLVLGVTPPLSGSAYKVPPKRSVEEKLRKRPSIDQSVRIGLPGCWYRSSSLPSPFEAFRYRPQ